MREPAANVEPNITGLGVLLAVGPWPAAEDTHACYDSRPNSRTGSGRLGPVLSPPSGYSVVQHRRAQESRRRRPRRHAYARAAALAARLPACSPRSILDAVASVLIFLFERHASGTEITQRRRLGACWTSTAAADGLVAAAQPDLDAGARARRLPPGVRDLRGGTAGGFVRSVLSPARRRARPALRPDVARVDRLPALGISTRSGRPPSRWRASASRWKCQPAGTLVTNSGSSSESAAEREQRAVAVRGQLPAQAAVDVAVEHQQPLGLELRDRACISAALPSSSVFSQRTSKRPPSASSTSASPHQAISCSGG